MSTTLPHGIIQINEGNIAWYGDITANWQLIDSKIGVYDAAIATIPAPANNGTLTINYGGTTIAMFGADDAGNVSANIPAPGDGALTVTQGGSTLGTFTANQAAPETIDIPAPGDGTLTIQQNGTTVDTFTANSSSDKTVNIQCVDLTSNQTVAGNKEFTGTTTAHDLVPSATNTYNFGSSSYQWNNAYIKSLTINGVACGDILTHNASEFVDVSSNQTIGGIKTFSNIIYGLGSQIILRRNDVERTVLPASTVYTAFSFNDKSGGGGTASRFGAVESVVKTNGDINLDLRAYDFSTKSNAHTAVVLERKYNGTSSFYSEQNNTVNLGTSTNKWKDVNTVLLNGKTPAYSTDIPTKVSQLTNDSGFITSENALPIGSYIQFAGSQAPAGFLVCNGGAISRTTYSALFAVIGTTYGSGDGSTTFNLPNLTDRFLQGSSTSGTVKNAGLPNIIGYFDGEPGVTSAGGAITVSNLSLGNMASQEQAYHGVNFNASRSDSIYGNSATVQPPALTCLICIKY